MDDVLSTQFERLEKALGTLVDSIAAYNPSPQAAIDLVAADDELSHGLDRLAKHQANHARIQALRAEADALEEQLKSSVEKLATLRHELFETPATTFPEDSRPVPFDELLQYASNISKHTVPPTYRERLPGAVTDADKDKDREDAGSSGAPTNGLNTPAHIPDPTGSGVDTADNPKDGEDADGAAPEITEEEAEWLKKLKESQFTWYPWPSTDKIRQGNLYKLQYWREKNADLDTFDIPAYEEEQSLKDVPATEAPPEVEGDHPPPDMARGQQPAAAPVRRPQPRPAFELFDDMDD